MIKNNNFVYLTKARKSNFEMYKKFANFTGLHFSHLQYFATRLHHFTNLGCSFKLC